MCQHFSVDGCRGTYKKPVAGISAGLVVDENDKDRFVTFIDIQGIEDFLGTWTLKLQELKMVLQQYRWI